MTPHDSRNDRVRFHLRKADLDALLVSSASNVSYLTGFGGDSSYLLVGRHNTLLLSDGRFTEQIREECPGLEAVIRRTTGERMPQVIAQVCRRMRVAGIMTVSEMGEVQAGLRGVEIRPTTGIVEELRACKDAVEVRMIRQAVRFAEAAYRQFRSEFSGFATEKCAADRLEALVRQAGGIRGSFDAIIAVGPHAAQGHARPDSRPLEAGRTVVVDWGAAGRFYKSDLTRTLCVRTIPAKLEAVYKVVLRAQERAIQKIRPGIRGQDVDAEARSTIERAGFGRFFSHGTGHGIGLEVHESPALRPNSQTILKPGMVVTVEPGIYIRGWGGVRIEDDVLVTRTGHEVLSTLPKNLASVLI
jgi:Xaa-Pro aminopeptidase